MAPAAVGGKWGVISERGNFIVEPKFTDLGDAHEGLIPAKLEALWGYVDTKGEWKISPQFLSAKGFRGGWAKVSAANGKDGWVNLQGKFVTIPPAGDLATVRGP